jgi:hypothetical protein
MTAAVRDALIRDVHSIDEWAVGRWMQWMRRRDRAQISRVGAKSTQRRDEPIADHIHSIDIANSTTHNGTSDRRATTSV